MNTYLLTGLLFVIAYITAWFDKPILAITVMLVGVSIAFFKYLEPKS